jgi:hypothetical protein
MPRDPHYADLIKDAKVIAPTLFVYGTGDTTVGRVQCIVGIPL